MKRGNNYNIMKIDNTAITDEIDLIASAVDELTSEVADLDPTEYTGYDATKTQVLKNVSGTLTWVTEETPGQE